ncbi:MAG: hypothetical protein R3D43_11550 [Tepidamorphaceae bacterium]
MERGVGDAAGPDQYLDQPVRLAIGFFRALDLADIAACDQVTTWSGT